MNKQLSGAAGDVLYAPSPELMGIAGLLAKLYFALFEPIEVQS